MQVIVYIDGFNLYYRRLQGSPYKWLDIALLAQCLAPGEQIARVRYFTAKVGPKPWGDPQQPQRQQVYLRALDTLPQVMIHYGRFKLWKKSKHLVRNPKKSVRVYIPEEKGSDVNLASYLILDAARGRYDLALIVSNDSDLKHPIHIVRHRFSKQVGVILPGTKKSMPSGVLPCDFEGRISDSMLHRSQLPGTLSDATGSFHKPPSW
jgi:hypothetical protein